MTRYVKILESLNIDPNFSFVLEAYCQLFARWNSHINLSAARTEEELAEHITDSLHVVPRIAADATVIDVGAGGGLPCVVVAICRPDTFITALEPVHKKHAFLRTVARELRLANLEAFARRIDDHDERDYDVAMSRATFDLREWLLLGLERVRVGGHVLGFEGVARSDLPTPLTRSPYDLAGKQRAIVSVERCR